MVKTVILFGSENHIGLLIEPMFKFFHEDNTNFILFTHELVHKNTWNTYDKENKYCDIVNIQNHSLNKILKKVRDLKPKAIILTNYKSLANFIILKIAHNLSITTIFLQHGIFDSKIENLSSQNGINSFTKYFHLSLLYFQFIQFNINLTRLISDLRELLSQKKLSKHYKFDFAVIYAKSDFRFIADNFNVDVKNILMTGYPIFSDINAEKQFTSSNIKNDSSVLLLHQPFNDSNNKLSFPQELLYYKKIRKVCKNLKFDFLIKLHPRANINNYLDSKYSGELNIIQNSDLLELINTSSVGIGFNSTAFYYYILMKKPIIQIAYPGYDYPKLGFEKVSLQVSNIKELHKVLSNKNLLYSKIPLYNSFIKEFIGKHNTFEYMAKTILGIVNKSVD